MDLSTATPGFMFGAVAGGEEVMALEDYGYRLESAVLMATSLGLGTCWLGGTFTRSSFSRLLQPAKRRAPAGGDRGGQGRGAAQRDGGDHPGAGAVRQPPGVGCAVFRWFFRARGWTSAAAGKYAEPLEMVRLAPSASNKQPVARRARGRRLALLSPAHAGVQRRAG